MKTLIGRNLGHYLVVEQIGAGGMGIVYRARDLRLGRDVAIKVLPDGVASDPSRLRRFQREAKALASLSHPNIVAIHDFDTDGDTTYSVTELLQGETLREHLAAQGAPFAWRRAAAIACEIANGLQAAHEHGVIHRDIKPSNIFICADGRVKILDFGLVSTQASLDREAETESIKAPLTHAGTIIGTAGYMSPEQVRGWPTDHRSDIFSFGAVLYEMLTGRRAFDGETSVEAMAAILYKEAADPSERVPTVPGPIVDLVTRCLKKDLEERYQRLSDVAAILDEVLGSAETATAVQRNSPRNLMWGALVTAGVLCAIAVAASWPWLMDRITQTPGRSRVTSIAILPLQNLTGDPDQQFLVDGLHEELITTFNKISSLDKVIGRVSAMTFQENEAPILEVGRKLSVDAVIAGSVRRSGNVVRITVRLIDVESQQDLWAESFQDEITDTITMHRDIAQAAAAAMQLALTPDEESRLASAPRGDPRAQEAYFRGLFEQNRQTQDGFAAAIELFQEAIQIDPAFAPAYAALAGTLSFLGSWGVAPPSVMERARETAVTALDLDETLVAAHISMAAVMAGTDRNWVGAEAHLRRAIALEPTSSDGHAAYSRFLNFVGRCDEALEEAQTSVKMDPLSLYNHRTLGTAYYCELNFKEARDVCLRVLEQDPHYAPALWSLIVTFSALGDHEGALDASERFLATPGWGWAGEKELREFRNARESSGFKGAMAVRARQLKDSSERQYFTPSIIAYVHALADQPDSMFDWLERAEATRDPTLVWALTWVDFDPYRQDPRFQDLLRQMNYPTVEG